MTRNVGSLLQERTMVMFSPTFTVVDAGPTALRAIVSGADKIAVRKRVLALADMLGQYDIPGRGPLNTTNDSLLVEFDPSLIEAAALKRLIRVIDASTSTAQCT
jgi:allophanate hydrolase subunit 1